jgi:hypothetical protein
VHTGAKSSKRRPYTETTESSYSHKEKDFEVHFKDKSKKNTDEAKKLVYDLIDALKREFATEPKEKQKRSESRPVATLSSIAGSTATTTQPIATVSRFTTTPNILSRRIDRSGETDNWAQGQFVIENFTKQSSIETEDEGSGNE